MFDHCYNNILITINRSSSPQLKVCSNYSAVVQLSVLILWPQNRAIGGNSSFVAEIDTDDRYIDDDAVVGGSSLYVAIIDNESVAIVL